MSAIQALAEMAAVVLADELLKKAAQAFAQAGSLRTERAFDFVCQFADRIFGEKFSAIFRQFRHD